MERPTDTHWQLLITAGVVLAVILLVVVGVHRWRGRQAAEGHLRVEVDFHEGRTLATIDPGPTESISGNRFALRYLEEVALEDREVRATVAMALLYRNQDARCRPFLRTVAQERQGYVRYFAIAGLAQLGGEQAVEDLVNGIRVEDEDLSPRIAALLDGLAHDGGDAVVLRTLIEPFISDENAAVREAAVRALKTLSKRSPQRGHGLTE